MRSKYRIELTTRDLEILQFVFEHRAVGHRQIASRFFKNNHRSVAHDRLTKLSKAGFLQKESTLHAGAQTLFYLITDKGMKAFGKQFKYEITSPSYKSDSINHDLGLVEVRNRLESLGMVVEYLSESVLQSCNGLIESEEFGAFSMLNSDAALVIETKEEKYQVALEYEVSDKMESRYVDKLTDYYLSPSVDAVFYICGNSKIEKLIRKIDGLVGEKYEGKVYTCLEENIQSHRDDLPFLNRKNTLFLLK